MTADSVADILQMMLTTIFMMSAPVLFTGLAIGFLVSVFQAATQINEVTLVFIPKMFATGLVLWLAGDWIFGELATFIHEIAEHLPQVAHGGG